MVEGGVWSRFAGGSCRLVGRGKREGAQSEKGKSQRARCEGELLFGLLAGDEAGLKFKKIYFKKKLFKKFLNLNP